MTLIERWKRKLGLAPPAPAPDPRRSSRDDLTDLSNRVVMHDTLVAALRAGVTGVVVLFDLDNFKYFNDRHGHRVGDELLRVVAARLREDLAAARCLARVGGDQFMAFLPGLTLEAALRAAQDCVEAMREPVTLASGAEIVTLCAGVASLDAQAGRAVDAVWRACDAALHAAKVRGRDRVVAFDDDTRQIVGSRRDLAATVIALQERNRALREEARTDALTGLRNRLALDELLHASDGGGDRRAPRSAIAFIDVDHFGNYNHVHGDAAGDDALREEARTDALTGLRNRLALDELLHTVAGDGDRHLHAAAIAFIDVDHFGNYNHVHGDTAGDDALKAVAHAVKACAREADFVFRKGGEEFVVLLRDVGVEADNAAVIVAAERIRSAVQDLALAHAASTAADVVTVTIGVASGPPGTTLRQLLGAAAEKAMAGKVGEQRNRVHAVRLRDFGMPG